ncbi:ribbon-helix-helix protein, CopG family [Faecalispora jeddahensis]
MTDKELETLDYCCKMTKMSRSEVIRAGIELIYSNLCNLKEK